MVVAAMLKGKRVHPDVSFGVVPGSRQVLRMITDNGALGAIIDSGARLLESGCGFCAGYGQSPQSGGNSIRTNNRNFEGRSGTKDAKVYLVSPETAAATALTGRLTDPRDLDIAYPDVPFPSGFYINDALIVRPGEGGGEVFRGPNISEPPRHTPLPADLLAGVAIKVGDQITTDHIIATGSVSRYRSNIPKSSEFVFQRVDPLFVQRCKENGAREMASVIVAGLSYGQGSSREHAALCPAYLGVRAVIAKSVERIHAANLVNFGILPLVFTDRRDYENIEVGDELFIADTRSALNQPVITVKNRTRGLEFTVSHSLTPRQIAIIQASGA